MSAKEQYQRTGQFDLEQATKENPPRLHKTNLLWLIFFHLSSVIAFLYFDLSLSTALLALALYIVAGLGITVGYHRLLTHRSFRTPLWLERVFAVMGTLAFEGGPITWVAQHRQHHLESDKDLDPHNIRVGFWHAHLLWIFDRYPDWYEEGQRKKFAPDLMRDPFLRWLDRNGALPGAVLGVTLLMFGGWEVFLWAFCVRITLLHHATWFVNSAAHIWGYRHFKNELATNNWWVAILALGEGWHNMHHAHPTSARHGMRFWEVDVSWMLIWTLSKLGLATKIKIPKPQELPWTDEYALKSHRNEDLMLPDASVASSVKIQSA